MTQGRFNTILSGLVLSPMILFASPVAAQTSYATTWVASTGSDSSTNCSRAAPCASFNAALGKTSENGHINILDQGYFSIMNITKSVTIRAVGLMAGMFYITTAGITINAPNGRVVLGGLDVDGYRQSFSGIRIEAAADVLITNCQIRNTQYGIDMLNSTPSRVTIQHSTISNNQTAGIRIASTPGTGHVKLFDSLVSNNVAAGVSVIGANNDVFLYNNRILGSTKSLDLQSGGLARSFGMNVLPSGDAPTSVTPAI